MDVGDRIRVWRLQGTTKLETHPSWDRYGPVRVERPAAPEGWRGYWWARPLILYDLDRDVLIRSRDVKAARRGEDVDIFVPGLYGCPTAGNLEAYIEEQIGGVDEGLYVALYEGEVLDYVPDEGAVVFRPIRLLQIWPAPEWLERARAGEFDDEDIDPA